MNKIYSNQGYLLDMCEDLPLEAVTHKFFRILNEIPNEESLDPKWLDLWNKLNPYKNSIPIEELNHIEKKLNLIKIVDDEIFDIKIGNDIKITFLLGAGASAPSGIPTVNELLAKLWDRARKIGREDLDRLSDWCDRQGIDNIEDLLTAAYISNFAAKNNSVTLLLDYFIFSGRRISEEKIPTRRRRPIGNSEIDVSSISFLQDTLQTLFGLLTSTMISAAPNTTHKAIVNFLQHHNNASIITTNYDGCMDETILKANMKLIKSIAGENRDENETDAVELIKMHGSINWAYCDSCQDVREFDLLRLKDIFENDELSFPVMGICKNCGGLRRPLLVPPLSFKFLMFPNLIDIWNSARQSIETADYIIVIGYSFAEADTYITKIVSRSMSKNRNQKIIIVDTNIKLVPALRKRFSAQIDEFDERRILKACESCDQILPKILKSLISEHQP